MLINYGEHLLINLGKAARLKTFFLIETCQLLRRLFYCFFYRQSLINLGQPVLLRGKGRINVGRNVKFGVNQSPGYLNTVGYLEAREKDALISIGDNVVFNNNVNIISRNEVVTIGNGCLIGNSFKLLSSDFHSLEPNDRAASNATGKDVNIGCNVFIADGVTVLKGVSIGDNSVVGAGSIVTRNIPENSVYAGNPAVFIKRL